MKVVKWGVHGTGTCIGPGILLDLSGLSLSRKPTHLIYISFNIRV